MKKLQSLLTFVKHCFSQEAPPRSQSDQDSTTQRPQRPRRRLQRRPPPVQYILQHREHRLAYVRGETPLAALYRMYEYLVLDDQLSLRDELRDFWHEGYSWPVVGIPDPKDPNPARYAILAVMSKFLVDAFNRRIEHGLPRDTPMVVGPEECWKELLSRPKVYEKVPPWANRVPKLKNTLFLPDSRGTLPDGNFISQRFREKNIFAWNPHIHFA